MPVSKKSNKKRMRLNRMHKPETKPEKLPVFDRTQKAGTRVRIMFLGAWHETVVPEDGQPMVIK